MRVLSLTVCNKYSDHKTMKILMRQVRVLRDLKANQ